ncbi:hypothetical protein ACVFYP_22220 [Roseomonas sp. F4]
MLYARIVAGEVFELIEVPDGAEISAMFHPDIVAQCVPVPAELHETVAQHWLWTEEAGFTAP